MLIVFGTPAVSSVFTFEPFDRFSQKFEPQAGRSLRPYYKHASSFEYDVITTFNTMEAAILNLHEVLKLTSCMQNTYSHVYHTVADLGFIKMGAGICA